MKLRCIRLVLPSSPARYCRDSACLHAECRKLCRNKLKSLNEKIHESFRQLEEDHR